MNFNKMEPIVLSSSDLYEYFQCANEGGMRYSSKTDTLLLITKSSGTSSLKKNFYSDKWDETHSRFYFTGEGRIGDQKLTRQNKRLAEYLTNTTRLFLFEQNAANSYIFYGEVILDGNFEKSMQPDSNGQMRMVYLFPLKIIGNRDQDFLIKKQRKINLLSIHELKKKVSQESHISKFIKQQKITARIARSPYVVELARRLADGICQLCKKNAPFISKDNKPFLEVHHNEWLSEGGSDIIENAIALCPNCHRKIHNLRDQKDIDICKKSIESYNLSSNS